MVYYFSATGNTRYVANLLAKELGDNAVSITASLNNKENADGNSADIPSIRSAEGGKDVLCFPVHGWRVPSIVEKFLKAHSLSDIEGSIYVVLTCGDDCGQTIKYLRNTFNRLGLGISIAGAFSITMPESYVGLPFMDVDNKTKEQQKLENARKRIPQIAKTIREGRRGVYEVHEGACAYLKSKVIGGFFHHVLVSDKTFHVDANVCIGCGKCVDICQVDNMMMSATRKPVWKHTGRCMTCMACYHVCPRHAISLNGMTRNKGQYFMKP